MNIFPQPGCEGPVLEGSVSAVGQNRAISS